MQMNFIKKFVRAIRRMISYLKALLRNMSSRRMTGPVSSWKPMPNRKEKILRHIDPSVQIGLEIGPLSMPIVSKKEYDGKVWYIDYASSEKLKEVYRNDTYVKVDDIVETDYIWGEQSLPELVNGTLFQYVVASHVIEHVPDMIGWLNEIAEVLDDNGILSLAIPDKRYTFDVLRELSTPGMLIDAHIRGLRRPDPQAIFDYMTLSCALDSADAWDKKIDGKKLKPASTLFQAYAAAQNSFLDLNYRDAHVNIFTPSRFLDLVEVLSRLNLLEFTVVDIFDTAPYTIEFFVSLERLSRMQGPEQKIFTQLANIEIARKKISIEASYIRYPSVS
jgi:hypothetical protein